MNKVKIPEPDLDNFLKQTLKDDLPPEAEARMNRHFRRLKRTLDRTESSGWSPIAGCGHAGCFDRRFWLLHRRSC